MDRQRLLDIAAEAIRTDLLEPQGLNAPYLPIDDGQGEFPMEIGLAVGVTRYTGAYGQPTSIGISDHPMHQRPLDVVATLAHEMLHSALPWEVDHGPVFEQHANAMGLIGPPTSTVPGPQFIDWFNRRIKPALA
ncbi:MAG: hypothetical protein EPO10_29680 [Reyranella sp.]|uniref:hypothetical protein n=1 Tax=Reyranella sp. TaxID=1929291 RepID=UPI0011FB4619|nr:hypothetical protein [Reyranella sp.]TAJ97167.1 MAG: hypothetical protein EPO41_04015 [Reyranella sp.]TBR21554.1 MAG: hypothetical protein EPO10_29680 [Reyranella sp.]